MNLHSVYDTIKNDENEKKNVGASTRSILFDPIPSILQNQKKVSLLFYILPYLLLISSQVLQKMTRASSSALIASLLPHVPMKNAATDVGKSTRAATSKRKRKLGLPLVPISHIQSSLSAFSFSLPLSLRVLLYDCLWKTLHNRTPRHRRPVVHSFSYSFILLPCFRVLFAICRAARVTLLKNFILLLQAYTRTWVVGVEWSGVDNQSLNLVIFPKTRKEDKYGGLEKMETTHQCRTPPRHTQWLGSLPWHHKERVAELLAKPRLSSCPLYPPNQVT